MIPRNRFIENLQLTLNYKNQKGAIVECGVWKGGMIAAMAELSGNKNVYYLFDSFEGLPKVENIDGQEALNGKIILREAAILIIALQMNLLPYKQWKKQGQLILK
jgi:hypothetical protein